MNDSKKTLGQTAYEAYSGNSSWEVLHQTWKGEWERTAQAVLHAHMPKITAAEVQNAVATPGLFCYEFYEGIAHRLNARLSHPQPASVESRPVEVEWEYASGEQAIDDGWLRKGCQMRHKNWKPEEDWIEATGSEVIGFSVDWLYRRPKINPQPEGEWEHFTGQGAYDKGLVLSAGWQARLKQTDPWEDVRPEDYGKHTMRWWFFRRPTPKAGAPSAGSGETRTDRELALEHTVEVLSQELDKLRAELSEAKKDQDWLRKTLHNREASLKQSEDRWVEVKTQLTAAQSQAEKDKTTIERLTKERDEYKQARDAQMSICEGLEIDLSTAQAKAVSPWVRVTPESQATKDEQIHLLACLAEECGEVAKECHKAIRFGLDDKVTRDPKGPRGTEGPTNREKIVGELNDIFGAVRLMICEGILPPDWYDPNKGIAKGEKVRAYMQYSRDIGHLPPLPNLSPPETKEDAWGKYKADHNIFFATDTLERSHKKAFNAGKEQA